MRTLIRGLLILALAFGAVTIADTAKAPPAAAQVANHEDGVIIAWSPCAWVTREGHTWCYHFKVFMAVGHDTDGVDEWQPRYDIECWRWYEGGGNQRVLCNFELAGFQAHGFSKGTNGTMTTWGTTNPPDDRCVSATALNGAWRQRHETFRWVMGQLDHILVRFLDANCNHVWLTNVYHAATYRVNIWAYDLQYEAEVSDPIRTGLRVK
jgi:hypothetical protein